MGFIQIALMTFLLAPSTQPSVSPPLYQMKPSEIGALLPQWQRDVPALNERVVAIARRNLGQPYELYLLGEAPFETIDGQPIYCIEKSDCVVFVEHTLAMALSNDLPQFLKMLQRIRYTNGQIGVRTRNHYTEADWNVNNRWMLHEITSQIAGENASQFSQKIDRARFFKNRYKLDETMPIQEIVEPYIPYEKIDSVKSQLRSGDIVNFVRGSGSSAYVGHVGLVARTADGTINIIHSAEPAVREEPIDDYIARFAKPPSTQPSDKPRFMGFKFLRLNDDPWAQLRKLDGPDAPRISAPAGTMSWDDFVKSVATK